MGMSEKDIGGGPATGLANDFVKWLQDSLHSGTFGGGNAAGHTITANPMTSTMGISGVLNDILSGGAGKTGGALAELIQKDNQRQVDALRARFGAGGGTAFGTPAAYGEAMLRSEEAPKLTTAIGNLQLQALAPILQMMYGLSQKGIPQREATMQPSGFSQALSTISQVGSAALPFLLPGVGAAASLPAAGSMPMATDLGQNLAGVAPNIPYIGTR